MCAAPQETPQYKQGQDGQHGDDQYDNLWMVDLLLIILSAQ